MSAIRPHRLTTARMLDVNATHSQYAGCDVRGTRSWRHVDARWRSRRSSPADRWRRPARGRRTPQGLLETIHKHITLTSTVTDNGDLNPYAVVVAPVSAGKIQKDDVLVDNFNNLSNLQGTGTTIVDYNPSTKQDLRCSPSCRRTCRNVPGGVGLTTAMTMLKSGWVIVGSTPSTDGTTATKGAGCLLVLDANGQLATVWTGPNINGPWGNMAVIDNGRPRRCSSAWPGSTFPGRRCAIPQPAIR